MNTPSQDRAKYNDGECLTTFQLETDQSYHKELREFWNKTLYGWGIIGESSFRLSIEDEKIRLSQGAAITSANVALLSEGFIVPVLLNGSEDINFGLVVIHGTTVDNDPCGQAEGKDGENPVQLIVRDTTAGDVEWLSNLDNIDKKIEAINKEGKLVVGLLERTSEKKWRTDKRFRQQGPIDAPGSKDAARVVNAITISSALQSITASKLRSVIGWGALATVLSILLWILVWWCNYFVAPQVPYRIVMEPQNDLQGPIAGKTYANGGYETDEPKHFAVTVQDQFGDPIEGVDVVYMIGDLKDKEAGVLAPTDAVFLTPQEAVGYYQELVSNTPQKLIVKTNTSGRAFPPGIRFSAEAGKSQSIHVGLINNGISLPTMTRMTVLDQTKELKFPGHFLNGNSDSVPDIDAEGVIVTIPVNDRLQRAGANKQVTIRCQTFSGVDAASTPVSMPWEKAKPLLKAEFKRLAPDTNGNLTIVVAGKEEKFKLEPEGKPASSVEYINSRLTLQFRPPEKGFYLLQFYETNEAGVVVKEGDKPKKIPGQLVFEVVD
jgi:hypothetical protein